MLTETLSDNPIWIEGGQEELWQNKNLYFLLNLNYVMPHFQLQWKIALDVPITFSMIVDQGRSR